MTEPSSLPFGTRLWFCWVCLLRVLFDGAFAARVVRVREAEPALPPAQPKPREADDEEPRKPPAKSKAKSPPTALGLLALLQREGRLVDFLEQDIASFSDAEIGAAARVVHEGCRKALRSHAKLTPVRDEEEGAKVTLEAGFSPAEVKLIGNVAGSAPYKGVLRHKGWRALDVTLPTPVAGHDITVIAPAEVEL